VATVRPEILPVLPLREAVVFPLTIAPVSVERPRARRLVDDVSGGSRLVALVALRETDSGPPLPEDLYAFGTAAVLHDALRGPDDTLRLAVQGLDRVRIVGWARTEPYFMAHVQWLPDAVDKGAELDALVCSARALYLRFLRIVPDRSGELASAVEHVTDARQLAYLLASTMPMTTETRQRILEQPAVSGKLRRMIDQMEHDITLRERMQKIAAQTVETSSAERDVTLRRPVDPLPRELGELEGEPTEGRDLRGRIARLRLPEEARGEVFRELDRLERTPASSPEHGMIRTYIEWVLKLPWGKATGGAIDVARARQVLDEDHYELSRAKDRIIEYLAVRRLRADRQSDASSQPGGACEPILCLVGPPGVGKTSLGQSIARALSRKFARVALGGLHDEAEIRGHRRTYIGAMPGRILQALARAGAADPVFMLDEVDKLGVGFHGDPAAALLEVLDPAQNSTFVDSYLGVPFDLSRVLFVCTANGVDTIPGPLLDRMEVLFLAGYTDAEKLFIVQNHLLPKAVAAHGLRPDEVVVADDAIRRIVRGYTREAGVRGVGREIGSVLRKVACSILEGGARPVEVTAGSVPSLLGPAPYQDEPMEPIDRPGVATGLAWMPTGGDILFVEASIVASDEPRLVLTGMMGNVMRESAQAALSYLQANAERFGVDARLLQRAAVHVHVPAGAVPKDGPSAGVTILAAIASQAIGRAVRGDLGMTGEVTLRGRVLAVGGVKEKVLAAHRAGLRAVLLPRRSEVQLEDVPNEVRAALEFVLVDSADEVLAAAVGLATTPGGEGAQRDRDRDRPTLPIVCGPQAPVH
jgi:ATP-dependent Lon protease